MERSCSSLSNEDETCPSDSEIFTMEWLMNDGTTEQTSSAIGPTNWLFNDRVLLEKKQ